MRRKNKLIIFFLLIILIIVGVTVPVVLSQLKKENENKIRDLIVKVDEYASLETLGSGTIDEIKKPMKVFIISNQYNSSKHTTNGRITYSDLMFKIDESLMATQPDEVNTLIRIKYGYGPELTYDSGDKGVGATIELMIIDLESKKILSEEVFYDRPPSVKVGDGDEYGDIGMLKYDVVKYINELGGF